MKICFIVGAFPSLSETFILNQMTGLLDGGHTLRILAGAKSSDIFVHEEVVRFGLLAHVRFHNDKPRAPLARVLSFLFLFPLALCRAPLPVLRSLDVFRFGREAWSLNLFFKMLVFLEVRDYDILFCHFGQNGIIGARMKEIGAVSGKLVTVFHAADITAYIAREGRGVYRDLFARGDFFLPISFHAKSRLLELGCPQKNMQVHRMGVDVSRSGTMIRKRSGMAPLRLLSVARLVEKKGFCYALDAVALLSREGIACEYTLVGDGPLREELVARARAGNISGSVRFAGWQDSGSVWRFLRDADIFLAPGIVAKNGDEEGVPVVLMEAMASNISVITTPTGGILELVEDGKTGFLVPPADVVALADCIRQVGKDPVFVAKVAGAGRERIEQEYDVEKLNQQLVKLFMAVAYEKHEE